MKNILNLLIVLLSFNFCFADETTNQTENQAQPPKVEKSESVLSKYKMSAHVSYNMAETMETDRTSLVYNGATYKGETKGQIDKSIGLGLEGTIYKTITDFEFIAGIQHDFARPLKSISYRLTNFNYTPSSVSEKISQTTVYLNLKKDFEKYYFFGGLNISNFQVTNSPGVSYKITPGLGLQAGVNFKIDERISLEVVYKISKFDLKQTFDDSNGTNYFEHKYVGISGILLNLRFFFK